MIFGLFRKDPRRLLIDALHRRVADAARDPALYARLGVPDTVEGRFESLALHLILLLRLLRRLPAPAKDVAQDLVDAFFRHLDASLREMGVGDMGVPKRMKKLMQAFYARAAAYDDALEFGGAERLAAALAEPFGAAADAVLDLARYALAAEAALAADTLDTLVRRGPSFPPPARFVEEGRP
jgi:cytochrome b pre-mRNA-processing protein 3